MLMAFQSAAEQTAQEQERLRLGDGWIGTRSVGAVASQGKRWRRSLKGKLRRTFLGA